MKLRILTFALLAFCLESARATPVTIDAGSFIRDRAASYADGVDLNLVSIVSPGVTGASATTLNSDATSSSTATITTGASTATFRMDTSQNLYPTGVFTNTWVELYFSTTVAMDYVLSGSLLGSSADESQVFSSKIALADQFLVNISSESDSDKSSASTLSVDGAGVGVVGSTTGTIGPGSYLIRMEAGISDLGDGLVPASLNGFMQLDLTAVSVPAPVGTLPFLLALGLLVSTRRLTRRVR